MRYLLAGGEPVTPPERQSSSGMSTVAPGAIVQS